MRVFCIKGSTDVYVNFISFKFMENVYGRIQPDDCRSTQGGWGALIKRIAARTFENSSINPCKSYWSIMTLSGP